MRGGGLPSEEAVRGRDITYKLYMAMVGGAYLRDKSTCARTLTENVGGLICEGERICGTLRYMQSTGPLVHLRVAPILQVCIHTVHDSMYSSSNV